MQHDQQSADTADRQAPAKGREAAGPDAPIMGAIFGVLGGLVAAWGWQTYGPLPMPPDVPAKVIVLDYGALALDVMEAETDDAQRASLKDVRQQVMALSEKGYVVLDAASVVSAPEDRYLHNILARARAKQGAPDGPK